MGKSSGSAPAAPDPVATANAQTASNKETAIANAQLNRVNQFTPYGSSTYTSVMGDNGTPIYTQNINLSPDQQRLFDSSNRISQGLSNIGETQLGNVANAISKPMDFSQLPQLKQSELRTFIPGVNDIQNNIDASKIGDYQRNVSYGNIQNQLDTSGVPKLVGGDALAGAMNQQQQAAYQQQKAFLDPQWSQREHDLQNQLVQQGIPQNSDAWNRAMGDLNRQRTFEYSNAGQQAIQLGNQAQNQLFSQGLAANQNAFGQALGSGQFANSAQAQGFGQAMDNAKLNNDVTAQKFAQAATQQQAANAAQNQTFNQMAARTDQANNAYLQDFNRSQAARNQGLNELQLQQNNPLAVLNALRTGAQPTLPSFGNTPGVNQANTDVIGPINQAYQGQLSNYNANVAQNNSAMGGIAALGSAAIMAF